MSKKVLIFGIVVLLAVGGAGTYVWVDYSQAQTSLTRSRLEVRTLGEHLDRHQGDAAHLKEMYSSAKLKVDLLEKYHSTWIDKRRKSRPYKPPWKRISTTSTSLPAGTISEELTAACGHRHASSG